MGAVRDVPTPDAFRREVLEAAGPVVVLFWATWCPFCVRFKPLFDAAAEGSDLPFAAVHLEEEDNPLWDDYDVKVIPTLALFKDGELVDRQDGTLMRGLSEAQLRQFLAGIEPTLAAS